MEIININFSVNKKKNTFDELSSIFSKYVKGFIFEPSCGMEEELTDEDREERYRAIQKDNERMLRERLRESFESIRVIMG